MARDLFAYPEEIYPQQTPEEIDLFKKYDFNYLEPTSVSTRQ
jgi:hypothetical protein